jgi:hypothetical protein
MKINEVFDKPYKINWTEKDNDDRWTGEAWLADKSKLTISMAAKDSAASVWDIVFFAYDNAGGGGFDATGKGDEFRVFSTVVAAVKEWYAEIMAAKHGTGEPLREIRFSGDKDDTKRNGSRIRLYDRFAKQFAQKIGMSVFRDDQGDAVEWVLKRAKQRKRVQEVVVDNRDGRGATPNNMNVNYLGMKVEMRPTTFIKLAAPLGRDQAKQEMIDYVSGGGAIGAPFLIIKYNEGQVPEVVGHEGRNRMLAVYASEGDVPVETHLFFRGDVNRARHLTPEIVAQLKGGMEQEVTGQSVKGPLWEDGRIVKGVNTTADVKPGETKRQAAKFGNKVDSKGEPPLLNAKARKNSNLHVLNNLGLTEAISTVNRGKEDKFGIGIEKLQVGGMKIAKMPGGFDLFYTTSIPGWAAAQGVLIAKDKKVAGVITTSEYNTRFENKVLGISTSVAADEFQGKGIVYKAYVALIKAGYSLISDDLQTQGGKIIWKKLAKTPGVFVYGISGIDMNAKYTQIDPDDMSGDMFDVYKQTKEEEALEKELGEIAAKITYFAGEVEDMEIDIKQGHDHPNLDKYKGHLKSLGYEASAISGELVAMQKTRSRSKHSRLMATAAEKKSTNEDVKQENVYGYKIMNYNPSTGEVISGADSRVSKGMKLTKGMTMKMPKPGIFMSTNREYVETYYGGHNDNEVLIKFKFNPAEITTGNTTDRENEFTVTNATVVGFKVISNLNESNPFTDARMNAIKAGKKNFKLNGKMYKVTGDITDELNAQTNEAIKKPKPEDTLGVKRHEMPQVHAQHYPELFDYLADNGATMKKGEIAATKLRAVQSEFSDEGVEKMMRKGGITGDGTKKPLIVSSDNYIIDGHHRWLAAYNNQETVPIIKFSIPVKKLLELVRDFKHTTYKDIYNEDGVSESLDKPYGVNWIGRDEHKWSGTFTANDGSRVLIKMDTYSASTLKEELFANGVAEDDLPDIPDLQPVWIITFNRDGAIEKTEQGDQQRIFATVVAAITTWFNAVKPLALDFSASKSDTGIVGSRARLYQRFAKMLASKTNYTLTEYDASQDAHFVLVHPKLLKENLSITGTQHSKADRKKKLQPGTQAWFKHWFSRPKLTRNDVDTIKEEIVKHVKESRDEKEAKHRRFNRN